MGGQGLKISFCESLRRPYSDERTPTGIKPHERKPTAVTERSGTARLRGFSGQGRDRITNDFVDNGGRVIVSISASDAGFFANDDCGEWTRR